MPAAPPLDQSRFQSLLDPLSWLLLRLAAALDEGPPARPPRWVRIAAAREHDKGSAARNIAEAGVTAWIELVSSVHELAMDLLEATDPYTMAHQDFIQTLGRMRQGLRSPDLALLRSLLPAVGPVIEGIDDVLEALVTGVDLIPDADDARVLGQQVFALVSVRPTPHPGVFIPGWIPPAVDLERTGRLRLLSWAFDLPWPVRGLGDARQPEGRQVAVGRLGSRWLSEVPDAEQAPYARALWVDGAILGARSVPVYELFFTEAEPESPRRAADLLGLNALLVSLGYLPAGMEERLRGTWNEGLSDAIEAFQARNGLVRTRSLDPATLARLMHLDLDAMSARRALPQSAGVATASEGEATEGGALALVNADANDPAREGIVPEQSPVPPQDASRAQLEALTSYRWYRCGQRPSGGKLSFAPGVSRGWIQHDGESDPCGEGRLLPGFTALERRALRPDGVHDGGVRSEGGTPDGPFFFCARHQAPSIAGRQGASPAPLWEPARLERGALVGIYQWADLSLLPAPLLPGDVLVLRARARMRALVPPQGDVPRGRLVLAQYDRARWEKELYGTVFDPKAVVGEPASSGWWPDDAAVRRQRALRERGPAGWGVAASEWVWQEVRLEIAAGEALGALYLGLHGWSPGGEDVGILFDLVELSWTGAAPRSALQETE